VPGRIFISYRRQDASDCAGRLYDRLAERFGQARVFMDVDTIELGVDFAEVVTQAVGTCEVLLAVIGPHWLSATGRDGRRRLDDPDDLVRLEVQAALDRNVRVIPVLVGDTEMPQRGELPESLGGLVLRNGLTVRHRNFGHDVAPLVEAIERMVAPDLPVVEPGGLLEDGPDADLDVPDPKRVLWHPAVVWAVAFSPDGRLLATASDDSTARLWEVASGQERARLAHDERVYGVAFSPDGRLLATGSYNGAARLWEVASGEERARLAHDDEVHEVAFSPDGRLLATASVDTTVRLWEVASGQEHARLAHKGGVYGVSFSPDGGSLATASDGAAQLWEVASRKQRARLAHDGVTAVAFSPDGRLLATASVDDSTARLWEVASGQERGRLAHDREVYGVVFSPDGRLLATASWDSTARLWNVTSGQERGRLAHDSGVHGVAFSPDGRLLATASWDSTARLWEVLR